MAPLLNRLKQWVTGKPDSTGEAGEKAAERFLKREKGYRIRERNWRSGQDEIDLIAVDGDILVIVEVKTRKSGGLVPGYYSVDKRKKRALRRATQSYFKTLKQVPHTYRLDVIEVNSGPEKDWQIHHFSNVEW